jgi:hypothetical protein
MQRQELSVKMSINSLSTELLQKIYEYTHVQDALHLAQTSKKHYRTFLGRRMPILEQTMHNSYGPLPELVKLVFSKETEKSRRPMGTELRRTNMLERILEVEDKPKLTLALIKKMVEYGKVAEKWVELYPRLRWRFGSHHRRLLRSHEVLRVHRAVYNYWTYNNLFHDKAYTQFDPESPVGPDDLRFRLVCTFSENALHDLSELVYHIRLVVELDLFPSNRTVQEHHGMPLRSLDKLAWGDEDRFYWHLCSYAMKLSPADFLYLIETTNTKAERAAFVDAQGDHLKQTPATLNQCLLGVPRHNECCYVANSCEKCLPSVHVNGRDVNGRALQEDIAYWTSDRGILDLAEEENSEIVDRKRKRPAMIGIS